MVPVEIFGLQVEESTSTPLLLLRELARPHRVLPIFIGGAEAVAIVMGLQGLVAERPLTHDLLVDMLTTTGTRLEEVAVTEVRNGTFLAELHLAGITGSRVVSSRPSDAIALAVRMHVPLFASESVMDEASAVVGPGDGDDGGEDADLAAELAASYDELTIDEEVDELREFLADVDPADFGDGLGGPGDGGDRDPS